MQGYGGSEHTGQSQGLHGWQRLKASPQLWIKRSFSAFPSWVPEQPQLLQRQSGKLG